MLLPGRWVSSYLPVAPNAKMFDCSTRLYTEPQGFLWYCAIFTINGMKFKNQSVGNGLKINWHSTEIEQSTNRCDLWICRKLLFSDRPLRPAPPPHPRTLVTCCSSYRNKNNSLNYYDNTTLYNCNVSVVCFRGKFDNFVGSRKKSSNNNTAAAAGTKSDNGNFEQCEHNCSY